MPSKRSVLAAVGALVCLLAAVFAAAPAQATVPAGHGPGGRVLILPPAPSGASAVSARSAAVSTPTSSPSVRTEHKPPSTSYTCASGNLCAVVWDPTTSDYKIFFFYSCNRYYLSSWDGTGNYYDHQTGGVTSYFYGQSGNVLKSFTPDSGIHDYNWTPVWSIRNC
ncbi:hypothetical protein [Streptomyces sp. SID12488]|uniref:hypothetical protein n=1 Tax=Streptomyces sp. SID12488 TaxID=2706040 RepID=UPI0013DD0B6F|nr:hypothetical protein [Streptomyces sp. SID12488]NEA63345.1 hypothetical protein [Streptomyces sp. SID12488]